MGRDKMEQDRTRRNGTGPVGTDMTNTICLPGPFGAWGHKNIVRHGFVSGKYVWF